MDFNWILIRYGEIGLKSSYVRKSFEKRLMENIRRALKSRDIEGEVQRGYGRIFINTKEVEKTSEVLKHTFGVVSFSPSIKIESGLEKIVDKLTSAGKEILNKKKTFGVRARRTGNHAYSSKDVEEEAGRKIIEATGAGVDLDNPDERIMADIRQGQAYIFTDKVDGPGGLPLGTQGKIISLFDGGFKSFLATWLMMKRGCSVVLLCGEMGPYSSNKNTKEAVELLKKWSHGSPIRVLEFNHGKRLFQISEDGERGYNCTLCKRFLYRLADEIAKETKSKAIVTGETINKNFSDFRLWENGINHPVVRPLVGLDENEIRKKCEEVGAKVLIEGKKCEAEDKERTEVDKGRLNDLEGKIGMNNMLKKVKGEVED